MIEICEIFRSIQGESTRAGKICSFVRLSGCNLRCRYCDTAYAWAPGEPHSVEKIVDRIGALGAELVTVTGGEPLRQAETPRLCAALKRAGHTVMVETNGSFDISALPASCIRIVDVKCPGSGEHGSFCIDNIKHLTARDECKFVLSSREDFDWALAFVKRHRLHKACEQLFSPNMHMAAPRALAAWILETDAPVRLAPQLHTIIWGTNVRGV